MKRKQQWEKRACAFILSAAMVLTPVNSIGVQAEEAGNAAAVQTGDAWRDGTGTGGDSKSTGGSDTAEETNGMGNPDAAEETNATGSSDEVEEINDGSGTGSAEEADTENSSEAAEDSTAANDAETGGSSDTISDPETPAESDSSDNDDSETLEGSDSADAAETPEEISPADGAVTAEETEALSDPDAAEDMAESSLEETDRVVLADDTILYSGTSNHISWEITTRGKLTIEGTGDYKLSDTEIPAWCNYTYRQKITSAEVHVTGITSTKSMFAYCYDLKTVDLSGLDTSNVTDMSSMFYSCSKLTEVDVSQFDTSKVTDMSSMFDSCGALVKLDVSQFNTSKVTDMNSMFCNCWELTELDVSHFDTSKVKDLQWMFFGCRALTKLDVSKFNTGNVTSMESMFDGCSGLTSLDVSGFDTGKTASFFNMFDGCSGLTSLDVGRFKTSNATSLGYMFSGCSSLQAIDVSGFDTSNARGMGGMFKNCSSLKSLDVSSFDTSKVTNTDNMFYGCSSLITLDVSHFDTGEVTYAHHMFTDCSSLTSLQVCAFAMEDESDASFEGMFSGCSSLTNLDLSSFDTYHMDSMKEMFRGCSSLTSLDVSGFKTGKVTNMTGMFRDCSSLVSLNISGWDTYMLKYVAYMFAGCSSLNGLDLSGFELANYKSGGDTMLSGCDHLTYVCGPIKCSADSIVLPVSGADRWYREDGSECTYLPANITVYKNGYPGDAAGETKKVAFVTGITVRDKIYDKTPVIYEGTPVVKDAAGNIIEGLIFTGCSYTGSLTDGSAYADTAEAPSQAGSYTLSIVMMGEDVEQYNIQNASYFFAIQPKTLTITAPSLEIATGAELPALSGMAYTVEGLLDGESLMTEPQLRYGAETIDTAQAGRYQIIPAGADAGNNYQIKYVNGTLTIGAPDDTPPEVSEDDSPYEEDQRTDLSMEELKATVSAIKAKTYDGNPYEPTVKVTVTVNKKKKTLTEGTDYRVSYANNRDVGTEGQVIIRGNGLYKGELVKTFTIKPKSIKKLKIVAGSVTHKITAEDIAGGTVELPIYVYDGRRRLTRGKDYNLSFKTSTAKTVTINIESAQDSNYTGATTTKLTIYEGVEASQLIDASGVTLGYSEAVYTGKAIKPGVTVKAGDTTLATKNYKVQYQNNKNAGTAYVIVTGKGKYKGKAVLPFTITPDKSAVLQITNSIKAKTYNGKLQKPAVTVKVGKTKLKKNTDYTVSYTRNLHEGTDTATITVTGTGNYANTVPAVKTFTINPQKISKVSVKGTRTAGLTITYGNRRLKEGTDYTLSYQTVRTKNKVKVTVTAIAGSDFTGSVTKTIKIQ